MGCDFYTYYVLHIEYKNKENVKTEEYRLDETRDRHYFYEGAPQDEDFEDEQQYYSRIYQGRQEQIDWALSKYKTADLFSNRNWLCIPSATEKYKEILKKLEISEDSLIRIVRKGGYHMR